MTEAESNKETSKQTWFRRRIATPFLVLLIGFGGAPLLSQAPSPPTTPTDYSLRIGVGDTLNVNVFETPSLSFQGRVNEAGNVEAPVLGIIHVAGLTTLQAASQFESELRSRDIMHQPSVTVSNAGYATQGIVVLGEVRTPGNYTLLGPHSLYDALAAAGGATDAEGPTIAIAHHGDPDHPEIIPVNTPNYSEVQRTTRVFPGDTVFVSKAELIYVVGDVGHPGVYPMPQGKHLNILEVLALAQGTTVTTAETHVSIVRTTPTGVITIPVNVHAIKTLKEPDVALNKDDILVLPRSGLKFYLNQILPGASLAATSSVITALIIK